MAKDETYFKALGTYTHYLEKARKTSSDFRRKLRELRAIVEKIVTNDYPFSAQHLPPSIESEKFIALTKEIAKLNDEIEAYINSANQYAQKANRQTINRENIMEEEVLIEPTHTQLIEACNYYSKDYKYMESEAASRLRNEALRWFAIWYRVFAGGKIDGLIDPPDAR